MFDKAHLWITRNYKRIQHWLLIIVGVTLLVFSMVVIAGQNRLIAQVRDLSAQNKALAEDNKKLNEQTKQLGESNQAIAKQNRAYTRCIAEVFAKYTRDLKSITSLNLDTCTTGSQTKATNDTPTAGTPVTTTPVFGTSRNNAVAIPSASPQSSSNNSSVPSPNSSVTPVMPQSNKSQSNIKVVLPLKLPACVVVGSAEVC